MKKLVLSTVLFFVAVIVFGQTPKSHNDINDKTKFEQTFNHFELFQLDLAPIQQKTASKGAVNFDLNFGKGKNWKFHLVENDMRGPDYVTRVQTARGVRTLDKNPNVYTYRGMVNNDPDNSVRVTIIDGVIKGMIKYDGEMYFIEPVKDYDQSLGDDVFVLYNSKDVVQKEGTLCGVTEEHHIHAPKDSHVGHDHDDAKSGESCKLAEIALAADGEMADKFGSVANVEAHMLTIFNVVEDRYLDPNINIAYQITEMFLVDAPANNPPWAIGSSDFGTFLGAFRDWGPTGFSNVHDIGLLHTARSFSGSAVGLAYVGVICGNSRYSVNQDFTPGLTQLVQLWAHEMGHNWSAGHFPNDSDANNIYIMAPSIGSLNDQWSGTCITSITNHKNSRSCLDDNCGFFEWDAGIASITSPGDEACSNTFEPVVVLRNYGTEVLTSIDIQYDVNGGASQTFTWNGSLAFNETTSVTLPAISSPGGTNTFNARTVSGTLNGSNADEETDNDLASSSFTISSIGSNSVTLTIRTDNWGAETAWHIVDKSGTTIHEGGNLRIIPIAPSFTANTSDDGAYASNATFNYNLCLGSECYDFVIFDDWDDGICCSEGNGFYQLVDDATGDILASGESFAASESTEFCFDDDSEITILTTPSNPTIECGTSIDPAATGTVTASTTCSSGGLNISHADVSNGSCPTVITRTWTATDACSNEETYVQTITVEDTQAPTVDCGIAETEVFVSPGESTSLLDYTIGSDISDNCTAFGDLTITQSPVAGTLLGAGLHIVTVSAEDECGNIGSCQIEVTVSEVGGIFAQLRGPDCGRELITMNKELYANVLSADEWMFEITNTNTNEVNMLSKSVRSFNLEEIPSPQYNVEYLVRVRVRTGDVIHPYGNFCSVFAPNLGAQLRSADCGRELVTNDDLVYANVADADFYVFEFTNPNNGQVELLEKNTREFAISELNSLQPGTEYAVRVKVLYGTVEQDFGPVCTLTSPPVLARLRNPDCGRNLTSYTQWLYANITSANRWFFEITNSVTMETQVIERTVRSFNLGMFDGAEPNTEYFVRVALDINGAVQPYGAQCSIFSPAFSQSLLASTDINVMNTDNTIDDGSLRSLTEAGSALVDEEVRMTVYPNPFVTGFSIKLDGVKEHNETYTVRVIDALGKVLETSVFSGDELLRNSFGGDYAVGVYSVIVSDAKGHVMVARLIKK